jgi:hypothetical protein
MDIKGIGFENGFYSSGSGWPSVAGSFENGNKLSVSIKGWEFLT